MLEEAKRLQKNAVSQLVECVLNKKEIIFKAPTGSGKTYMMADLIDRLLVDENILIGQNKSTTGVVFLVSSLSKSSLAEQNYDKFCEYSEKRYFNNLKPYLITSEISGEEKLYIPLDYNVYFLPKDLFKKESRLDKEAMKSFLIQMTNSKENGGEGKIIILIKDEGHIKTSKLETVKNYFTKIITFSATPKLSKGEKPTVEIKEQDAIDAKLIKRIEWCNEEETVEDAIIKFKEIKKQYLELLHINPCLIIQISNKNKAEEELDEIYRALSNHQELKWMLIVNKEKECKTNDVFEAKKLPICKWKEYAKSNTSTIDIIIFKMVITEGWDIPRACMLYQMRDSQSKQLDEQVIGRIRRNPKLLDFENLTHEQQELAMQCWVWDVENNTNKQWEQVKLQDNAITDYIKIKITKLKTLTEKKNFNIKEFVESQKEHLCSSSIFTLGEKFYKLNNDIQQVIKSYATTYQQWLKAMENVNAISKKFEEYICNYEDSLEVEQENGEDKEVSFPLTSSYIKSDNNLNLSNCVWIRKNHNDNNDKFSFDSEAEREWANILKDISNDGIQYIEPLVLIDKKNIYLWGKNYLQNSLIKFEYYLDGVHCSYPDFIMKDKQGQIHIFEVKSVNNSNNISLDKEEYENKVCALKEAYKQASKITKQIFYLCILKGEKWEIVKYKNGEGRTISKQEFIDSFKQNN